MLRYGQHLFDTAVYSKNGAYTQASRLLQNAMIKQQIAQYLNKSRHKVDLKIEDILKELKQIAFANISDFCTWTAKSVILIPSSHLAPELMAAIESIAEYSSQDGTPQVRLKLHSKLRAAELILKIYEISEVEARLAGLEERVCGNEKR